MRLELGPRDLESRSVMCKMRIAPRRQRQGRSRRRSRWDDLGPQVGQRLDAFQKFLFERALAYARGEPHEEVDTWSRLRRRLRGGEVELRLRPLGRHDRDRARDQGRDEGDDPLPPARGPGPEPSPGKCIKTGKPSARRVLFAKNY
jgi:prolyl-tRNA synthetase